MARELYGVNARLRALPSERDRNFHLSTESGEEFVLKISNAQERSGNADAKRYVGRDQPGSGGLS